VRIVFVTRRSWPATGGMETFLHHLSRGLAEDHAVTVLALRVDEGPWERLADSLRPGPSFRPFLDGHARVDPLVIPIARRALLAPLVAQVVPGLSRYAYGPARVALGAYYARTVSGLLVKAVRGADVVHAWGPEFLARATIAAARRSGVPSVITPFAHRGQWGYDADSVRAFRAASAVVGLLKSEAALYAEVGVPANRLVVCGVASPPITPGFGATMRRRHGIDGPLILFLGVRRPYKGQNLLLEAVPLVAAMLPGCTFAFVGPGPKLEVQVDSTPDARILDIGMCSGDDRAGWLEAADLLCLPSAAEILPMSVLEAWSIATPVIVSDLPTLQELVNAAGGGIAVPRERNALAQSIVSLIGDSERRARLGEAGRAHWLANYSAPAVVERHESLYRSLLSEQVA
jgi:glycosyltransferase involved in cell wall biosynthesis